MTNEQQEEIWKRSQAIAEEIRELVSQRLLDVDEAVADEIRERLQECFRFWR